MRSPLPPHGAGDQDRNFRLLATAVEKRGLSSRSQGACFLRCQGRDWKLALASFPITVLRRAWQQLPGLPATRAQATPMPRLCRPPEPAEPLAGGQAACMSVRGQSGGRIQASHAPGAVPACGRSNSPLAGCHVPREWASAGAASYEERGVPPLPITLGFPSHTAGLGLLLPHVH